MHVGGAHLLGAFRERIATRHGEVLRVSPDPALIHLFDKATGQRI